MRFFRNALLLAALVPSAVSLAADRPLSIIPRPAVMEEHSGSLDISHGISAVSTNSETAFAARYFNELVKKPGTVKVTFVHKDGVPPEGYLLDVAAKQVTITASTANGFLYGAVTLWQMTTDRKTALPLVHIEDAPRFKWRGFMLDSGRHVQSMEFILQVLDYMAQHKLNTFHWHLTEDQGWRIEIKRYPKLTSVGAYRGQTMPAWEKSTQAPRGQYGTFFTQEQARRVVAYAKERGITVVPEIEMPGHASAAIAAYPELGSIDKPLGVPPIGWGIFPNLFNTEDKTFEFLGNVLLEIMDIFPSEYIHIGGDEAIKEQWKSNPAVQARMRALGIKDEDGMQSWFIQRMEKFVNAHGRKIIGWDEILQGGLAQNAAVMSWRGMAGGIAAAMQGHDTVIAPARPLYLNYRQSAGTWEGLGRVPINALSDVYNFEPASPQLTAEEQKHILGVESAVWSEYVIDEGRMQRMLMPRLAALAEIGWTPVAGRDYNNFLSRLQTDFDRTEAHGLHPTKTVFMAQQESTLNGDGRHASVALKTQTGYGQLHYTVDGSLVRSDSPVYSVALEHALPFTLRAQSFDGTRALGDAMEMRMTEESILRRDSRELDPCGDKGGIQMEQDPVRNAERPVFLITFQRPCWIYHHADLSRFKGLEVGVGSIPYVFHGPTDQRPKIEAIDGGRGATLEVHLDSCKGPSFASLAFVPAFKKDGVTKLVAQKINAAEGQRDLCFTFEHYDPDMVPLLNYIQPLTR